MTRITNQVVPMIGGKRHGYFVVDDVDDTPHAIKIAGERYELRKYRYDESEHSLWVLRDLSNAQVEQLLPLDLWAILFRQRLAA
jgi:hypothetical protein